jgi:ATP-binding cassette, subfamily B, multidrug efflux pump
MGIMQWFERRLDPYPAEPAQPPKGLVAFCLHFSKGAKRWLVLMAVTSASSLRAKSCCSASWFASSIGWALPTSRRSSERGLEALGHGGLPRGAAGPRGVGSLIIHQTLLGNFPQRIRWMVHRYLIRQSMSYFQDEFAGRIATKLMQTALAVREVVMKLLDVVVFVSVYFIGASSSRRPATGGWPCRSSSGSLAYAALLRHFIPRSPRSPSSRPTRAR